MTLRCVRVNKTQNSSATHCVREALLAHRIGTHEYPCKPLNVSATRSEKKPLLH